MVYTATSFVFGEQPSAAKWNQLGTNDAGFYDGSGFSFSNPLTAAASSHLELTPGTNKFVKIAVLRQDDTTNTYKNKSVILTGWGVNVPGAVAFMSETVSFGITFDQRPIVVSAYGGDNTAGTLTYGAGVISDAICINVTHTITTTNFIARMQRLSSSWGASTSVFYQWIAIGEITA